MAGGQGDYAAAIINTSNNSGLVPEYSTATPPLNALDPAPTEFSGYLGIQEGIAT